MPESEGGAAAPALPAYERVRLFATKRAELVVMRWTPGVASAVHDHGGGHGVVWLARGSLRERLYDATGGSPSFVEERVHHAPAWVRVASESLHTMESVGDVPARSIHLYREATSPMRVYDPARGRFVHVREGTPANLPVDESSVSEGDP